MKWGIIGALDAEIEIIKQALIDVKEHKFKYFTLWEGTLGKHTVYATVCSVATVNAAICTQAIIDKFAPDYIINTGIAGAVGHDVHTLDVVISDIVCYHDRDDIVAKYPPNTNEFVANRALIDDAVNAVKSVGIKYHVGRIATGDIFVSSNLVKQQIADKCAPLCVEMEGAAIAQAAYMSEIPFVVIRTMSDSADDNADETYDNLFEVAAQNSAKTVIKMIKEG